MTSTCCVTRAHVTRIKHFALKLLRRRAVIAWRGVLGRTHMMSVMIGAVSWAGPTWHTHAVGSIAIIHHSSSIHHSSFITHHTHHHHHHLHDHPHHTPSLGLACSSCRLFLSLGLCRLLSCVVVCSGVRIPNACDRTPSIIGTSSAFIHLRLDRSSAVCVASYSSQGRLATSLRCRHDFIVASASSTSSLSWSQPTDGIVTMR